MFDYKCHFFPARVKVTMGVRLNMPSARQLSLFLNAILSLRASRLRSEQDALLNFLLSHAVCQKDRHARDIHQYFYYE